MGTRDEELRVRATFDGSELKTGLDGVASAGTAAGAAVAAGGAKAADGLKTPLTAAAALEAAIKKTENAISPRGIIDSAARIKIALEDIEKEAVRTGQALGPDMVAKMRQAEAAYTAAIQRGGRLADTIADTRKQAGLAAEGYKTLGAAGGGLQGVFSVMDDAGKGLTSTLGKVGIGAIGLTQALKLGYDTGQQIRTMYQDLTGKELPNLTNAFIKLTMGVDDSTKAFDRHGVAARSHAGITNAAKQAVSGLFDQMQKLNPALKSADEEYGRGAKELDLLTQAMFKAASGGPGSIKTFQDELKRATVVLAQDFTKGLRDGTIDTTKLTAEQKKLIDEVKRLAAAATDASAKLGAAFAQIRDEYAKDAAAAEANRDKVIAASKAKLHDIDADLQAGKISLEQHSAAKRQIIEQERADEVAALEGVDAAKAKAVEATEKLAVAEGATAKQLVEAVAKHDAYGASVGASAAKSEEFARALDSVDKSSAAYTTKLDEMRKAHGEGVTSLSSFNEKLAAGETHLKLAAENTGKLGESITTTAGKAAASVRQLDAMAQAFDRVAAAAARAAGAGAGGGA